MRATGLAAGLLLALSAASPAGARLVREPAPAAENRVETGGQHPASGRTPHPCTAPDATLALVAWLSFPLSGGLPGDALACAAQPGQDYLQRAAAALRLAIAEDRATSWRAGRARAFGSIRLLRSYVAAGVTCRDFVHTLRIGRHSLAGPGTACLRGGSWRIGRPP
jgi:surface antigen